ncbi:MAG: hypothetical protein NTY43_03815 [Bacteroidetes bacterium]|nr:hypothetical protein [Bacteroidota bacterium]
MKNILLFILFLCSSNIIKAQDTLSMRSGENILVKVIEVGNTEVKYKKLDNLNGPIFSILKSDLLIIKYENGTKDDFSSIKKIEEKVVSVENFFVQGQNDAIIHYDGYKTAGTAVLLSTAYPFYGIFAGIVPALLTLNSDLKDENLGYPNLNLMKNEEYAKGYKQKAKQIKRKKVITNYVSGLAIQAGILVTAVIVVISAK